MNTSKNSNLAGQEFPLDNLNLSSLSFSLNSPANHRAFVFSWGCLPCHALPIHRFCAHLPYKIDSFMAAVQNS